MTQEQIIDSVISKHGRGSYLHLTIVRLLKLTVLTEDCWHWKGGKSDTNYGFTNLHRRKAGAHRVMYRILAGPIPKGMDLDHLCFNSLCVNPAHLEPVTRGENRIRAAARRTCCKRGHKYTSETTRIGHKGERNCKICAVGHDLKHQAKKRNRLIWLCALGQMLNDPRE